MRDSVLVVCYDLPGEEPLQKKEYHRFLKFLKRYGYIRIQKSLAIKHLWNKDSFGYELKRLDEYTPQEGQVMVWNLSYERYSSAVILRGIPIPTDQLRNQIIEI